MAKVVIDPVTSGYNLSKINANLQLLADELNDNVLYRNNPIGEPNSLVNDIDMNSNNILNAKDITAESLKISGQDVTESVIAYTGYAEEWAVNPEDVPVSVAAGGDGVSDFSSYHWAQKVAAIEIANSSFSTFEYTASEGQTVFTGADDNALVLDYTEGNIVVSLNGNILKSADYTAIGGTSITLSVGANVDDILQIAAYTSYVMTNSYSKAETDAKDTAVQTSLQANIDAVDTRVTVLETTPQTVGAMTTMTAATQAINTSTTTAIVWGDDATNGYDDDGFWDVASPTKLIIPTGYTRARFSGQMNWAFDLIYGGDRRAYIRKVGGGGTYGLSGVHLTNTTAPTSNEIMMDISTAIIPVTPGDEFEFVVWHDAGATINIQNSAAGGTVPSHFAIEVFK